MADAFFELRLRDVREPSMSPELRTDRHMLQVFLICFL